MGLHIITVATDGRYYFPYLVESCRRNNIPIKVLGMGEKWQGYTWKTKKVLEYAKTVDPDDILCFVDAYDVVSVKDLRGLKAVFQRLEKETGAKIIVGTENTNWFLNWVALIKFGSCNGTRLNSGTYIGRAKHIMDVCEESLQRDTGHNDDQVVMTELCSLRPGDFHIDEKEEIFSLYSESLYEFRKPVPHAFFVHGNACVLLNDLLESQGYQVDRRQMNEELAAYFFKKLVEHLENYFVHHVGLVLILCSTFLLIMLLFRFYWLWKIPVFLFTLTLAYGFIFFLFSSYLWEMIE